MNKDSISLALKNALNKVQKLSGEEPVSIGDNTIPIGELPGFDSLRAIEAIVELSKELDTELQDDINIFISKKENRALNINEITNLIYEHIRKEEK